MGLEELKTIEQKINEIKSRREAYNKLWIEQYIKLNEAYSSSKSLHRKERLMKGLEFLLEHCIFDGEKAKEIRIAVGLTQIELSTLVGWKRKNGKKRNAQGTISAYEMETLVPTRKTLESSQLLARPYFEWLKTQGYNPFNL